MLTFSRLNPRTLCEPTPPPKLDRQLHTPSSPFTLPQSHKNKNVSDNVACTVCLWIQQ